MRILLALEGSDHSLDATKQLAALPFTTPPEVTIVTALHSSASAHSSSEKQKQLLEAEKQAAQQVFQKAKGVLEPHSRLAGHVLESQHPRSLIIKSAAAIKADLVVLGAHTHSGIARMLLGSTADYVANHAECSVMIARTMAQSIAVEQACPFRVLLAYDGSLESKVAYQQMSAFDWQPGRSHLHIAMLMERPKMIPDDVVYDPEQIAEQQTALHNMNMVKDMGCDVKHSVREALHVGNAIRGLAAEEESNLVFFGGTGKSAIARFFLGSTSRYFLHHAACTMWIARENQWGEQ